MSHSLDSFSSEIQTASPKQPADAGLGRAKVPTSAFATPATLKSRSSSEAALHDVLEGLRRWELWVTMGWYDVRQHYRRSVLGPFWLTLSMAVMVGALGFLYGGLFGHSMRDYLPYLSLGLLFWGFMASFMTEGCTVFTTASPFIHQVNAPLSIYAFRLLWKNLIILSHNALVFAGIAAILGLWPGAAGLLAIPGLILLCIAGLSTGLLLGLLSSRFRDIPPIVTSLVQILFFASPILWKPEQVPASSVFVDSNPFFHLLNIVRQPLLGELPKAGSWVFSFGLTFVLLSLAGFCFVRLRPRIAYWV